MQKVLTTIKRIHAGVIPLLAVMAILISLQVLTPGQFGDPDGWYHLGISKLYRMGEVGESFPWLSATTLKDRFFDQQFLYHVLLAVHPTPLVAKAATVLISLLLLWVLAGLLRTLKVGGTGVWAMLVFIGSSGFLFRANLVKGGLVGVVLFIGTTWILLKKKYWLLIPLGIIWALSHGSFVLLLPLVISFFIFTAGHTKKDILYAACAAAAGIGIGLLVHPQHTNLIPFLQSQLSVPFSSKHIIGVGNEWYAYGYHDLLKYTFPLLPLWVITGIYYLGSLVKNRHTPLRSPAVWLWLVSIGWFCLFLTSKRFIEYWAPLSILPVALTLDSYVRKINIQQAIPLLKTTWQLAIGILVIAGILFTSIWQNLHITSRELKLSTGAARYEGVSTWLANNSRPGDIVFHNRWDHFPQLFYLNQKNYYIVGLDTTFMYTYSPDLYWKWRTIVDEQPEKWNTDTVYKTLKTDFNARYIFLEDYSTPKLRTYLIEESEHGQYALVYTDINTSIFELR